MIIKPEHGHAIGYCAKGMRLFCQTYGLDYLEFVRNGFDESVFLATGDPMAIYLVETANGRSEIPDDRV